MGADPGSSARSEVPDGSTVFGKYGMRCFRGCGVVVVVELLEGAVKLPVGHAEVELGGGAAFGVGPLAELAVEPGEGARRRSPGR